MAQIATADYAARRAAVVADVDSGVVVAFGAPEPLDFWPTFHQLPAFHYLTGLDESDAVLVMVVRDRKPSASVFVPTRTPVRERWVGIRTRIADMPQRFGMVGRDLVELPATIDSLAKSGLPFYTVPDVQTGENSERDTLTAGRGGWRGSGPIPLSRGPFARRAGDPAAGRRTPAEIALLRQAAKISGLAHRQAMRSAAPGCGENEIQALLEGTFRRLGGSRPGYGSIVGSGPNATILHYMEDSRVMQDGELLLVDAATAYDGYSADVTRTYPVNGRFTPAQRELYQIVRDAQEAFVRQIHPGVPYEVASDSGKAVVTRGLLRLGLIESADATFDPPTGMNCPGGCSQVRLYALHGYGGHGIGLEVHDPAQYYHPDHMFRAGDVFTVEPGLYVSPELLASLPDTPGNRAMLKRLRPAVEKYKNFGVRIEDDYALTERGLDWLSSEAPREIKEIESLMREREPEMPGGGKCGGLGKEAAR